MSGTPFVGESYVHIGSHGRTVWGVKRSEGSEEGNLIERVAEERGLLSSACGLWELQSAIPSIAVVEGSEICFRHVLSGEFLRYDANRKCLETSSIRSRDCVLRLIAVDSTTTNTEKTTMKDTTSRRRLEVGRSYILCSADTGEWLPLPPLQGGGAVELSISPHGNPISEETISLYSVQNDFSQLVLSVLQWKEELNRHEKSLQDIKNTSDIMMETIQTEIISSTPHEIIQKVTQDVVKDVINISIQRFFTSSSPSSHDSLTHLSSHEQLLLSQLIQEKQSHESIKHLIHALLHGESWNLESSHIEIQNPFASYLTMKEKMTTTSIEVENTWKSIYQLLILCDFQNLAMRFIQSSYDFDIRFEKLSTSLQTIFLSLWKKQKKQHDDEVAEEEKSFKGELEMESLAEYGYTLLRLTCRGGLYHEEIDELWHRQGQWIENSSRVGSTTDESIVDSELRHYRKLLRKSLSSYDSLNVLITHFDTLKQSKKQTNVMLPPLMELIALRLPVSHLSIVKLVKLGIQERHLTCISNEIKVSSDGIERQKIIPEFTSVYALRILSILCRLDRFIQCLVLQTFFPSIQIGMSRTEFSALLATQVNIFPTFSLTSNPFEVPKLQKEEATIDLMSLSLSEWSSMNAMMDLCCAMSEGRNELVHRLMVVQYPPEILLRLLETLPRPGGNDFSHDSRVEQSVKSSGVGGISGLSSSRFVLEGQILRLREESRWIEEFSVQFRGYIASLLLHVYVDHFSLAPLSESQSSPLTDHENDGSGSAAAAAAAASVTSIGEKLASDHVLGVDWDLGARPELASYQQVLISGTLNEIHSQERTSKVFSPSCCGMEYTGLPVSEEAFCALLRETITVSNNAENLSTVSWITVWRSIPHKKIESELMTFCEQEALMGRLQKVRNSLPDLRQLVDSELLTLGIAPHPTSISSTTVAPSTPPRSSHSKTFSHQEMPSAVTGKNTVVNPTTTGGKPEQLRAAQYARAWFEEYLEWTRLQLIPSLGFRARLIAELAMFQKKDAIFSWVERLHGSVMSEFENQAMKTTENVTSDTLLAVEVAQELLSSSHKMKSSKNNQKKTENTSQKTILYEELLSAAKDPTVLRSSTHKTFVFDSFATFLSSTLRLNRGLMARGFFLPEYNCVPWVIGTAAADNVVIDYTSFWKETSLETPVDGITQVVRRPMELSLYGSHAFYTKDSCRILRQDGRSLYYDPVDLPVFGITDNDPHMKTRRCGGFKECCIPILRVLSEPSPHLLTRNELSIFTAHLTLFSATSSSKKDDICYDPNEISWNTRVFPTQETQDAHEKRIWRMVETRFYMGLRQDLEKYGGVKKTSRLSHQELISYFRAETLQEKKQRAMESVAMEELARDGGLIESRRLLDCLLSLLCLWPLNRVLAKGEVVSTMMLATSQTSDSRMMNGVKERVERELRSWVKEGEKYGTNSAIFEEILKRGVDINSDSQTEALYGSRIETMFSELLSSQLGFSVSTYDGSIEGRTMRVRMSRIREVLHQTLLSLWTVQQVLEARSVHMIQEIFRKQYEKHCTATSQITHMMITKQKSQINLTSSSSTVTLSETFVKCAESLSQTDIPWTHAISSPHLLLNDLPNEDLATNPLLRNGNGILSFRQESRQLVQKSITHTADWCWQILSPLSSEIVSQALFTLTLHQDPPLRQLAWEMLSVFGTTRQRFAESITENCEHPTTGLGMASPALLVELGIASEVLPQISLVNSTESQKNLSTQTSNAQSDTKRVQLVLSAAHLCAESTLETLSWMRHSLRSSLDSLSPEYWQSGCVSDTEYQRRLVSLRSVLWGGLSSPEVVLQIGTDSTSSSSTNTQLSVENVLLGYPQLSSRIGLGLSAMCGMVSGGTPGLSLSEIVASLMEAAHPMHDISLLINRLHQFGSGNKNKSATLGSVCGTGTGRSAYGVVPANHVVQGLLCAWGFPTLVVEFLVHHAVTLAAYKSSTKKTNSEGRDNSENEQLSSVGSDVLLSAYRLCLAFLVSLTMANSAATAAIFTTPLVTALLTVRHVMPESLIVLVSVIEAVPVIGRRSVSDGVFTDLLRDADGWLRQLGERFTAEAARLQRMKGSLPLPHLAAHAQFTSAVGSSNHSTQSKPENPEDWVTTTWSHGEELSATLRLISAVMGTDASQRRRAAVTSLFARQTRATTSTIAPTVAGIGLNGHTGIPPAQSAVQSSLFLFQLFVLGGGSGQSALKLDGNEPPESANFMEESPMDDVYVPTIRSSATPAPKMQRLKLPHSSVRDGSGSGGAAMALDSDLICHLYAADTARATFSRRPRDILSDPFFGSSNEASQSLLRRLRRAMSGWPLLSSIAPLASHLSLVSWLADLVCASPIISNNRSPHSLFSSTSNNIKSDVMSTVDLSSLLRSLAVSDGAFLRRILLTVMVDKVEVRTAYLRLFTGLFLRSNVVDKPVPLMTHLKSLSTEIPRSESNRSPSSDLIEQLLATLYTACQDCSVLLYLTTCAMTSVTSTVPETQGAILPASPSTVAISINKGESTEEDPKITAHRCVLRDHVVGAVIPFTLSLLESGVATVLRGQLLSGLGGSVRDGEGQSVGMIGGAQLLVWMGEQLARLVICEGTNVMGNNRCISLSVETLNSLRLIFARLVSVGGLLPSSVTLVIQKAQSQLSNWLTHTYLDTNVSSDHNLHSTSTMTTTGPHLLSVLRTAFRRLGIDDPLVRRVIQLRRRLLGEFLLGVLPLYNRTTGDSQQYASLSNDDANCCAVSNLDNDEWKDWKAVKRAMRQQGEAPISFHLNRLTNSLQSSTTQFKVSMLGTSSNEWESESGTSEWIDQIVSLQSTSGYTQIASLISRVVSSAVFGPRRGLRTRISGQGHQMGQVIQSVSDIDGDVSEDSFITWLKRKLALSVSPGVSYASDTSESIAVSDLRRRLNRVTTMLGKQEKKFSLTDGALAWLRPNHALNGFAWPECLNAAENLFVTSQGESSQKLKLAKDQFELRMVQNAWLLATLHGQAFLVSLFETLSDSHHQHTAGSLVSLSHSTVRTGNRGLFVGTTDSISRAISVAIDTNKNAKSRGYNNEESLSRMIWAVGREIRPSSPMISPVMNHHANGLRRRGRNFWLSLLSTSILEYGAAGSGNLTTSQLSERRFRTRQGKQKYTRIIRRREVASALALQEVFSPATASALSQGMLNVGKVDHMEGNPGNNTVGHNHKISFALEALRGGYSGSLAKVSLPNLLANQLATALLPCLERHQPAICCGLSSELLVALRLTLSWLKNGSADSPAKDTGVDGFSSSLIAKKTDAAVSAALDATSAGRGDDLEYIAYEEENAVRVVEMASLTSRKMASGEERRKEAAEETRQAMGRVLQAELSEAFNGVIRINDNRFRLSSSIFSPEGTTDSNRSHHGGGGSGSALIIDGETLSAHLIRYTALSAATLVRLLLGDTFSDEPIAALNTGLPSASDKIHEVMVQSVLEETETLFSLLACLYRMQPLTKEKTELMSGLTTITGNLLAAFQRAAEALYIDWSAPDNLSSRKAFLPARVIDWARFPNFHTPSLNSLVGSVPFRIVDLTRLASLCASALEAMVRIRESSVETPAETAQIAKWFSSRPIVNGLSAVLAFTGAFQLVAPYTTDPTELPVATQRLVADKIAGHSKTQKRRLSLHSQSLESLTKTLLQAQRRVAKRSKRRTHLNQLAPVIINSNPTVKGGDHTGLYVWGSLVDSLVARHLRVQLTSEGVHSLLVSGDHLMTQKGAGRLPTHRKRVSAALRRVNGNRLFVRRLVGTRGIGDGRPIAAWYGKDPLAMSLQLGIHQLAINSDPTTVTNVTSDHASAVIGENGLSTGDALREATERFLVGEAIPLRVDWFISRKYSPDPCSYIFDESDSCCFPSATSAIVPYDSDVVKESHSPEAEAWTRLLQAWYRERCEYLQWRFAPGKKTSTENPLLFQKFVQFNLYAQLERLEASLVHLEQSALHTFQLVVDLYGESSSPPEIKWWEYVDLSQLETNRVNYERRSRRARLLKPIAEIRFRHRRERFEARMASQYGRVMRHLTEIIESERR